MIIDVFSDPICPWCFIGKRRMEKALVANGLNGKATVRWRAFQLNPGMPVEGMERQSYLTLKFGGNARAEQIYGMIQDAGKLVGIPFEFDRIRRTPNTVKAHRMIRLAARSGLDGEIVEALFRNYFLRGEDIGSDDVLCAIAVECGMDGDAVRTWLAGDEEEEKIREEHDFAVSMNIAGVPCFVIEGRYAVVGAQEPEAFAPVFELVQEEKRQVAGP
jgi:predicted DsbA family dithiol-disulfide isomerase